jgi:glyceraldehyde 3-phosphate dehydrogenase
MIPTTTGAAKTISRVLPHLEGKLDGIALRVPIPNVSAVDLTFMTKKNATKDAIRQYFKDAASNELKGIIGYVDEKMVSSDFNHNPHSTSFVADQVFVNSDNMMRIFSWYDNEWGYSNRMLDVVKIMMSEK